MGEHAPQFAERPDSVAAAEVLIRQKDWGPQNDRTEKVLHVERWTILIRHSSNRQSLMIKLRTHQVSPHAAKVPHTGAQS